MSGSRNPLIAALDTADGAEAERLAAALAEAVAFVKAGLTLFVAEGPEAVLRLRERAPVFLDLKLHDIPAQVEGAAREAARLDVGLLTVHALGGEAMVRAAVRGAEQGASEAGMDPPGILGVTVLSSLGGEGLASPASLAYEAVSAGARGVVVSGEDVSVVRETIGPQALVVVPGIRPAGHANNDQVRVLTPGEALERGADYLVIGRPITGSSDPAAAARAILGEVGLA
jgi:orotidine-5'-phosphate decarboxylase